MFTVYINLQTTISELRDSLNKLSDHNPGIIIAGDYNLLAIQWEEGKGCIQSSPTYGNDVNYLFIETINDSGLKQLVTEPTRNNHILNLVLTSQPDLINDVKVMPGISDHEAVTFKIKFSPTAPPSKLRKVYQYHKANTNSILEEMNHFLSTFLSQDPYQYSFERNWQILKNTLLTIVDAHVPHKTINPYKHLPWINATIRAQMRRRKKLNNKAKRSHSPSDWNQYKNACNTVNKSLKQAYECYCQYLFDDSFTNNHKIFWSLIKRSHKTFQSVAPLEVDNTLKSTPTSKAEALGDQFLPEKTTVFLLFLLIHILSCLTSPQWH